MPKTVNVRIFGREETISCEEDEVDDLIHAAAMLDEEMGRTKELFRQAMSFDRVCLLASLNLVHQLIKSEKRGEELAEKLNSLLGLRQRLDDVLKKPTSSKPKAKASSESLL